MALIKLMSYSRSYLQSIFSTMTISKSNCFFCYLRHYFEILLQQLLVMRVLLNIFKLLFRSNNLQMSSKDKDEINSNIKQLKLLNLEINRDDQTIFTQNYNPNCIQVSSKYKSYKRNFISNSPIEHCQIKQQQLNQINLSNEKYLENNNIMSLQSYSIKIDHVNYIAKLQKLIDFIEKDYQLLIKDIKASHEADLRIIKENNEVKIQELMTRNKEIQTTLNKIVQKQKEIKQNTCFNKFQKQIISDDQTFHAVKDQQKRLLASIQQKVKVLEKRQILYIQQINKLQNQLEILTLSQQSFKNQKNKEIKQLKDTHQLLNRRIKNLQLKNKQKETEIINLNNLQIQNLNKQPPKYIETQFFQKRVQFNIDKLTTESVEKQTINKYLCEIKYLKKKNQLNQQQIKTLQTTNSILRNKIITNLQNKNKQKQLYQQVLDLKTKIIRLQQNKKPTLTLQSLGRKRNIKTLISQSSNNDYPSPLDQSKSQFWEQNCEQESQLKTNINYKLMKKSQLWKKEVHRNSQFREVSLNKSQQITLERLMCNFKHNSRFNNC